MCRKTFSLKTLLLASLIHLITACIPAPGGDTTVRTYQVDHSGVATITRIYSENDNNYIDFHWQATNNIGKPEEVKKIGTREIGGLSHAGNIKTGDKLELFVIRLFRQHGSSTPELLESWWSINRQNN